MTRTIKYAGFSRVSDENGNHPVGFHTSNHPKYLVWAKLPEDANGSGYMITFRWFKLPEAMTKAAAVAFILNKGNVGLPTDVQEFLEALYKKSLRSLVKDKAVSEGVAALKTAARRAKCA